MKKGAADWQRLFCYGQVRDRQNRRLSFRSPGRQEQRELLVLPGLSALPVRQFRCRNLQESRNRRLPEEFPACWYRELQNRRLLVPVRLSCRHRWRQNRRLPVPVQLSFRR
jgi:hypothetical protein